MERDALMRGKTISVTDAAQGNRCIAFSDADVPEHAGLENAG